MQGEEVFLRGLCYIVWICLGAGGILTITREFQRNSRFKLIDMLHIYTQIWMSICITMNKLDYLK